MFSHDASTTLAITAQKGTDMLSTPTARKESQCEIPSDNHSLSQVCQSSMGFCMPTTNYGKPNHTIPTA